MNYNHSRYKMNKKEFSIFLNSEIESLRSEIQRPGWTTWALTGALAALVWILISLIEQGNYTLREIGSLLLVISFLIYIYALTQSRISPNLPSQQNRGRLMHTELLRSNIPFIILIIAQLVFLILVILQLSTELGSIATSISLAAVSIPLLSAVMGMILIATRFPVLYNPRHRYTKVVFVVCSVLMLLSVWYHIRLLWISPGGATIYDVRLALVIAAIFYLSCRLVFIPRGALTLDLLTTIRRELLFERIEIKTAIQQVDIALAGLRASDLLESYVTKLLSLYRDAKNVFSKSVSFIDQLEEWQAGTVEKMSPEQLPFRRELMNALESSIDKAYDIVVVDIPRAYKPIGQRLIMLKSMGLLEVSDDLKDLEQKLEAAQADLVEQVKKFRTKYAKIDKTVQPDEAQIS